MYYIPYILCVYKAGVRRALGVGLGGFWLFFFCDEAVLGHLGRWYDFSGCGKQHDIIYRSTHEPWRSRYA